MQSAASAACYIKLSLRGLTSNLPDASGGGARY